MPSRINRHILANAAEAVILYAWLYDYITLDDSVATLEKSDNLVEGLSQLLVIIKSKIKFS